MVEPLRHRQTKEAATDMFNLKPPRHISTLPKTVLIAPNRSSPNNGHHASEPPLPKGASSGLMQRNKGYLIRSFRQRGREALAERRDRAIVRFSN